MKKLFLLLLGGFALPAIAQQSKSALVNDAVRTPYLAETSGNVNSASNSFSHLAKTTAVAFETEDFSSGTTTTLSAGWSAGSIGSVNANASWKWRQTAVTGIYNIGVINSTTASNGWMVYDSDSIGSAFPTANPIEGYLQSPSYNCSGHASVEVSFQQHFRKFQDSCFVDVSTNSGMSFTTFPLKTNNALNNNSSLPSNPHVARVNISSVAANQANVIIRLRYKCTYLGGSYNWLVDDFALSELDPVELSLDNAGVVMYDGAAGFTSFGAIPTQFVDTLVPVVYISNNGSTDPGAITVNASMYRSGTSVYTSSFNLTGLMTNTQDSILDFEPTVQTATGTYTAAFDVNVSGDAVSNNNVDSITLSINDTLYHRNSGATRGSYYIHRSSANTNGEASYNIGTFFTIPVGKSDTLTGVQAAFQSATTVGSTVVAHVFKFISSGTSGTWDFVASTMQKTLTAADISVPTAVAITRFNLDPANGDLIMDEGDYAVVVQSVNVTDTNTVLLLYTDESTPSALNYLHGIGDTSLNDGLTGFGGAGNLPFRVSGAPVVRLIFGKQPPLGVQQLNANIMNTRIYPNPVKDEVKIAFEMQHPAEVSIICTNAIGQTIFSKRANKNSGEEIFNTSTLSNGVYFATIKANGITKTERFVVAH